MRRELDPEELVAAWTPVEADERKLVAYKPGATRLGPRRCRNSSKPGPRVSDPNPCVVVDMVWNTSAGLVFNKL